MHPREIPPSDFQALILCGPGVSLNTFTSQPEDLPKALIPIANRPMIWYPLDWCHRMGITNITLITPPSSSEAIEAALSRNPHLTSLPLPRADILAPESLSQNTGTAELLRLPEVQAVVDRDFLILPCDIVSELSGESLLESWMTQTANLIGSKSLGGGLGVWFETKGEYAVKGEETDFIVTTQLPKPIVPPPETSLRPFLSKLLYSTTTDTLRDITDEKNSFPIRRGLIRKHGRIRLLTTHRAAHIYLFPRWILDFVNRNPKLDSISEDVVGWWAKATWQDGLAAKLNFPTASDSENRDSATGGTANSSSNVEAELDLLGMSTTHTSSFPPTPPASPLNAEKPFPPVPPILAYIHPASSVHRIRRIDTPSLLLQTSLRLASLAPNSSPLSHPHPIHPTCTIAPRTTVSADSLLGPNTSVRQHAIIKNSVVSANCVVGAGARLTRCVIMDDVDVAEKCQLVGCVVGQRARLEKECKLGEGCEVQPGFVVEEGTEGRGEKFMVFEGLDEDDDGDDIGKGMDEVEEGEGEDLSLRG